MHGIGVLHPFKKLANHKGISENKLIPITSLFYFFN
jgi:hypothetical protein